MSGEKLFTVSEIADRAGVSRSKVWGYINRNAIKASVEDDKKFLFDEKTVSDIISGMGKTRRKTAKKQKKEPVSSAISESVLSILKQQLEEKDKQIAKLQDSLQFAQAAAAENQKKLDDQMKLLEHRETDKKDMQDQLASYKDDADKAKEENAVLKQELDETKQHLDDLNNRGFWQRLLRR